MTKPLSPPRTCSSRVRQNAGGRSPRVLANAATALAGVQFASLVVGCGDKPPEKKEEKIAPVKAAAAQKVKLAERVELLGTTMPLPNCAAQVSSPVSGQVVALLVGPGKDVSEGSHVKAEQPLLRLDDRVARANRDKAAAALADLGEQKKQADFAVELSGIEVKRLEELGSSVGGSMPLVSRVELEKAKVARKDAQSRLEGVLARQKSAAAELKSLNAQLDFYTLKAPIGGHLGLIQASVGQTLAAGTIVTEIVDLDEIDVLCHAPPRVARKLILGQQAALAGQEKPVGRVVYIAVQAQAETGNFDVKVRFPNKEAKLQANAVKRVLVELTPQPLKETWTIDEAAVMEDRDPPLVVVALDVKEKKDEHGEVKKDEHDKVEQFATARLLQAILGIRDREQKKVEILRLVDPDTKKEFPLTKDLLFVIEGGQGLENKDVLKLENE